MLERKRGRDLFGVMFTCKWTILQNTDNDKLCLLDGNADLRKSEKKNSLNTEIFSLSWYEQECERGFYGFVWIYFFIYFSLGLGLSESYNGVTGR